MRFLNGEIKFTDITVTVARVLEATRSAPIDSLEAVLAADNDARARAKAY